MDVSLLLWKTLLLRPYVFFFLAVALVAASRFLGWKRTCALFGITWLTAFVCEFSSTRVGFPFGDYYYTGSTVGEELYLANIPFMDSLSFTFLLYASYCLALWLILPAEPASRESGRRLLARESLSWPVIGLTCLLFMLIDVVIDPVALRGDRWFLGQIYGYPDPGVYFGVPLANFAGWFVVGLIAMTGYRSLDRGTGLLPALPLAIPAREVLLGCGLYYGVLLFNVFMTFWIGEWFLALAGCLLYIPVTALAILKLRRLSLRQPSPGREGVNALVLPSFVIGDDSERKSPTLSCGPLSWSPVPDLIADPGQANEIRQGRDPGSLSFTRAIPWRHLLAPAGVAAPRSRNPIWGRGLSERSEFRSPNIRDRGKGTRRATPGRPGFGSFCRNKRTSACGAEPPQNPLQHSENPAPA